MKIVFISLSGFIKLSRWSFGNRHHTQWSYLHDKVQRTLNQVSSHSVHNCSHNDILYRTGGQQNHILQFQIYVQDVMQGIVMPTCNVALQIKVRLSGINKHWNTDGIEPPIRVVLENCRYSPLIFVRGWMNTASISKTVLKRHMQLNTKPKSFNYINGESISSVNYWYIVYNPIRQDS